ncbi:MAG: DNA mismatch repair protein [Acidobacteriota bacterium]
MTTSRPSFPTPDLLHLDARLSLDPDAVEELLELSFLGKEGAGGLDQSLTRGGPDDWNLDLFAEDLFVRELIHDTFSIELDGLRWPVNEGFLYQVLSTPPRTLEAVRFRQDILRELLDDETLAGEAHQLYRDVSTLLDMFKAPDHAARLDIDAYRLDIFRHAKVVIDRMASAFGDARSGLARLAEAGTAIQASQQYRLLADLLEYEARQSTLRVSLNVGGDGEIKDLQILDMAENRSNPFYQPWWRRWLQQIKVLIHGYKVSRKVILQGLLRRVFEEIAPSLVTLVQVQGHLEPYLASLGFRRRMARRGLGTCLPTLAEDHPLRLDGLWNPLLLADGDPVPSDVHSDLPRPMTLVTGPNSGGKTRLLQSLGLAQLMGQCGLFVPATRAELPLVRGLFVSLVETETAHQAEGRLGRELLRIKSLFTHVGSPSLVILDELCSGTNPKEGIEIFRLVLRLLERLDTCAFISTHFLELAQALESERPHEALRFLRVETAADNRSTYQFLPGVAETSLAAETAQRLGVTFDELAELIDQRRQQD